MAGRWLLKVAALVGGVGLVLVVEPGAASADPRLDSAVNTTCSYEQVMAALNAQNSMAGSSPMMQSMLRQFLGASTDQRQQMAEAIVSYPANAPYLGLMQTVFDTCNNF